MKVFVWRYVNKCSDNYHSEGGVVVFAGDLNRARELANNQKGCAIRDNEMPDCEREVADGDEMVFIFPDAGCC